MPTLHLGTFQNHLDGLYNEPVFLGLSFVLSTYIYQRVYAFFLQRFLFYFFLTKDSYFLPRGFLKKN